MEPRLNTIGLWEVLRRTHVGLGLGPEAAVVPKRRPTSVGMASSQRLENAVLIACSVQFHRPKRLAEFPGEPPCH
jgi:hypothetical protein